MLRFEAEPRGKKGEPLKTVAAKPRKEWQDPPMGVRIDLEARTINVSPAALLERSWRRIGFDRGDGRTRQWLGQAVHRRVLEDARAQNPAYRAEVAVRYEFETEGYHVTFEGRIDGCYEDPAGRTVVEEIKSLHFEEELDGLQGSPRWDRYKLQTQWYLLALHETGKRDVEGHLVLADIETLATQTHRIEFDPGVVKAGLLRRVKRLLVAALDAEALSEAKAEEGQSLAFPFGSLRPGQQEILDAAARAAENREHLLLEAPTGIGKTAAALVPLVKSCLVNGWKLYVLTSKTTQQDIFMKTLRLLSGESFRTLRLRAKEKICANDVLLCHEEHCRFASEYGAKLESSGIVSHLLSVNRDLEPSTILEAGIAEEVCPFELSLELSEEADVVIGDYNYAFDPWISLSGFRDPHALSQSVLLVDEIHNLVDRARGYFSPSLSEERLDSLSEGISHAFSPAAPDMLHLLTSVKSLIGSLLPKGKGEAAELVPLLASDLDDLRIRFEATLARHIGHLKNGGERIPEDPLFEAYFDFARFHDVLRRAEKGAGLDEAFDVFVESGREGARLGILCKDPSGMLAPIFGECVAVVGMSATLTPPEFYRDLLGFSPDRTVTVSIPSPFPKERRLVRIESGIDTRYAARQGSAAELAGLLTGFTSACPGNVLVLFPSYRFLDEVQKLLPHLPGRRLVRPSTRSTELERESVFRILSDGGAPVVLMTVSGGPFAEGVDYPGRMLLGVVVVSPALPQVKFEQERLKEYFSSRFERGFEYAYVIPGMTRVVQSAGRLIRTETDFGMIVLVCRRFLQKPYSRYLPRDWFADSPSELKAGSIVSEARDFFSRIALTDTVS